MAGRVNWLRATVEKRIGSSVRLRFGAYVFFPSAARSEPYPGVVRVLETDSLDGGYLTAQTVTYEYCFRVEGRLATLTTLTRRMDAKGCGAHYVPDEVRNAIHWFHPTLRIDGRPLR